MNTSTEKVLACVDQSASAQAVTEHAAWLAERLSLPLALLHVIERHPRLAAAQDHSGALGVDAQDHLLQELSDADAQRSRQAREAGRLLLTGLRERAAELCNSDVDIRQRHGDLDETLLELEPEVAHYVLGRQGEGHGRDALGETPLWLLRSVRRPVWLVPERFTPPSKVLVAFDGGASSRRAIAQWARSPLLQGLEILVLMAGESPKSSDVDAVVAGLQEAGLAASAWTQAGAPEEVIPAFVRDHGCDLLLMGAYSHSFWRSIVMGSKTQEILRRVDVTTWVQR